MKYCGVKTKVIYIRKRGEITKTVSVQETISLCIFMGKMLFVCNTVYQLFIALWLKETELLDDRIDIIITDHMNNSSGLLKNVQKYSDFETAVGVKSKQYAYFQSESGRLEEVITNVFPEFTLNKFLKMSLKDYTDYYIANIDRFTLLLYRALKRRNGTVKVHIYEDGLGTYSQSFERTLFYREDLNRLNWIKRVLHQKVYRLEPVINDIVDVSVFAVNKVQWEPRDNVSVRKMNKINRSNKRFRERCNRIFGFEKGELYPEKYIFFEQPFEEDVGEVNDLELIKMIADRVGKDNIIIKTHPRSSRNRFGEIGLKTNSNSSIPWEVILLNMKDLKSKTLITVSSTCVITPWLLYGESTTVYSIYTLIKRGSNGRMLGENLEDATLSLLLQYSDVVKLVKDISEIE